MTINIERELGKLETKFESLEKRQDRVEQNIKEEVNTLKTDIKDLKRELQNDFKEIKTAVDSIKVTISDLKTFDSRALQTWKVLAVVGTIAMSVGTILYNFYNIFLK